MQPEALARIKESKHRTWTPELVHDLLVLAFKELPSRSIRMADAKIEPTHDLFTHITLPKLLELAGFCVEDKNDRGIMFYLAKREAWPDQGLPHEKAALFYHYKSRRGLYGAGNRARSQMARCLNERWILPPDLDPQAMSEAALLTVVAVAPP